MFIAYSPGVEISGLILTVLASYLLGSIPSGYLMARARGVDIRTVGSGNIGATNVFRILGKAAGITVLLLDAAKGFWERLGSCAFRPELGEGTSKPSLISAGPATFTTSTLAWWPMRTGSAVSMPSIRCNCRQVERQTATQRNLSRGSD